MAFDLKYMGTKRRIAPLVASAARKAKPGILLDCFSGMCAVGSAVAPDRQVWSNDAQLFASKAAAAMFTFDESPPSVLDVAAHYLEPFETNSMELYSQFHARIDEEAKAINSEKLSTIENYLQRSHKYFESAATEKQRLDHATKPSLDPCMLFALLYADTYFGLQQCIEIDSIIFAIHDLARADKISFEGRDWLLLALGQAMIRSSNTVGHFAQYLTPKDKTLRRYLAQRRRSIRIEWLKAVEALNQIGNKAWRRGNKTFCCDSAVLVASFKRMRRRPSVVYADPPYTDEQYSRFYHLLETVFLYDYPAVTAKARYRIDRFQTAYSQTSRAVAALTELAQAVAGIGADLLLSYPTNGLLHTIGAHPIDILRQPFAVVRTVFSITVKHSTFGASNGLAEMPVTEALYHAKP